MANDTVVPFRQPAEFTDALTSLLREKAQELLRHAVEAEVAAFLDEHARCDEAGRREVVRNGYQPQREILTGLGPVAVKLPKVRDRAGQGRVFRSDLVPRYVRKAASVEAVLPWLYLYGISADRMGDALTALLGEKARARAVGQYDRSPEGGLGG